MAESSKLTAYSDVLHSKEEPFFPSPVKIHFPSFASKESRLESLKDLICNHPHPNCTIEVLAEDGFFYLGTKDYIVCFVCKLCLQGWGDEDDVAFEHALSDPVCPHLVSTRSETFVMEVRRSIELAC